MACTKCAEWGGATAGNGPRLGGRMACAPMVRVCVHMCACVRAYVLCQGWGRSASTCACIVPQQQLDGHAGCCRHRRCLLTTHLGGSPLASGGPWLPALASARACAATAAAPVCACHELVPGGAEPLAGCQATQHPLDAGRSCTNCAVARAHCGTALQALMSRPRGAHCTVQQADGAPSASTVRSQALQYQLDHV